jgi:aminoglycoside phosphotransferase (APT) family kinase protein
MRGHVTIVHGDAHAWNFLLPRSGEGAAIVFDWDAWRGGIGSGDLAYMIAMHWYPQRRARLESRMLDRYHAALVEDGVEGYGRDALRDDYRLSTLFTALTPVTHAWLDIPHGIWWNHLERIMMAVDDLGCRELLD